MALTDLSLKREYRSYKNNVVKEFYIPVLKEAILYRRAVGFFTSEALVEISKGISGLIENEGHIQLIVSPILNKEDIEAIEQGYSSREIVEKSLLREMKDPQDANDKERLAWISYLISISRLDIKVAFTKKLSSKAMFHEKMGIVSDMYDSHIAFTGSMNETVNAFFNNYESFDVYCSWNEYEKERVQDKIDAFEKIWNNTENNLDVIDFPKAAREKLLKYKVEKIDSQLDKNLADAYRCERNEVKFGINEDIELYDYQKEAILEWENQGYRGIFDMATGTGKTFTGLGAATWLLKNNKRLAVIIVCPYQHLVEQWVEDIERFGFRPVIAFSSSPQKKWKERLKDEVIDFNLEIEDTFCLVTTNATYTSKHVQEQIGKIEGDILIVVDEAHNFGAMRLSRYLRDDIKYRLALSATLERHGDEEGTQALYSYFGNKCIEYDLKRAIDEDKLTKYYYHPIIVSLSDDELEKYRELSAKISKACKFNEDGRAELSEAAKTLLIQRSRIVAGAIEKIAVLKELMKDYVNDNQILVYCGATKPYNPALDESESDDEGERQIVMISKMLGLELGMAVRHFTSNESAKEREEIKAQFAETNPYQALIAIKCLDEGVNIPSIKTAFILASSTNPKEYIQRRGRVLRKYPGKDYAVIYDFVTLPRPLNEVDAYEDNKSEISLARREIARMKEFGYISQNPQETDKLIKEITVAYGLDMIKNQEVDYEL
ncbi:DNA repair protein [Roseburia sp. AF22-2LB]|uniref:DEAD/DEAH box helicase family protein n=1 Tax=unclassified Roseburia TaxID=2637578 RepID=UPI000E4A9DFC|nr:MULTISPECIES: DEAD/DEAH box helicase family protein [unclassified Roseburia]RGG38227.1 DNA repair protein [Roseburia sp. AF22-8AC]RGG42454.1 DNA repair protein [Roseburia sp. AF22-2LB]